MLRRVGFAQRHNIEQLCVLNRFAETSSSLKPFGRPLRHQRCNASAAQVKAASATAALHLPSTGIEVQGDTSPRNVQSSSNTSAPTSATDTNQYLPHELYILLQNTLTPSPAYGKILEPFKNIPLIQGSIHDPEATLMIARAIGSSPEPLRAIHFLHLAHNVGLIIPQNVYQEVAFHLSRKRLWRGILTLVQLGLQQTGQTTLRLMNWRARALVETRNYAALKDVIDEYTKYSLTPSRRTYHLVLSGHIQNRDLTSAKRVLGVMRAANVPPDPSTDAIIATHYRDLGVDPRVEVRTLRALPVLTPRTATSVVNRLILLRLDTHDIAAAVELLGLFDPFHIDCITSTPTIQSVIDHPGKANIVPAATHRNLIPNADTYIIFLNFMATHQRLGEGIHIFRGMLETGIEPTTATVSALVNLLFAGGRGDTAVKLVAKMCSDTTSVDSFKPFFTSEDSLDFPWVPPSDLRPSVKIFNMLLRRLMPIHGSGAFLRLLTIMRLNDIAPTTGTLQILLVHLYKHERAHPGKIMDALRTFTHEDLPVTVRHIQFVLAALLRHEKYLLFGEGWNKAASKHSPTRIESYPQYREHLLPKVGKPFDPTAGFQIPDGVNLPARSKGFLKRLSLAKETSDAVGFAQRIRHEAMANFDPDTAKEILQVLLNRGMRPNEYHFSALMEGLARSDDLDGAWDALRAAEHVGCRPNAAMFTVLISGYARKGDPDRALRAFDFMVASGVQPDVGAIDAVASAFFAVGQYSMCRQILVRLWAHIEPFPPELQNVSLRRLVQHFRRLDEGYRNPRQPSRAEGLLFQKELKKARKLWRKGKQSSGSREVVDLFSNEDSSRRPVGSNGPPPKDLHSSDCNHT